MGHRHPAAVANSLHGFAEFVASNRMNAHNLTVSIRVALTVLRDIFRFKRFGDVFVCVEKFEHQLRVVSGLQGLW